MRADVRDLAMVGDRDDDTAGSQPRLEALSLGLEGGRRCLNFSTSGQQRDTCHPQIFRFESVQ